MRQFKIVVEHREEGYVAYPLGLRGVVVGEGGTLDEALADVGSAIEFHLESFGSKGMEPEPIDVIVTDVSVSLPDLP